MKHEWGGDFRDDARISSLGTAHWIRHLVLSQIAPE